MAARPSGSVDAHPDDRHRGRPAAPSGVSRVAFLNTGRHGDAAWVLSMMLSTVVVAFAVLFASQREQRLLIEKESLSAARAQAESERADAERERAEAEQRFRLLADNAVDVVVHHRGFQVVWVSPSVETAFGWPPEKWIGSDLTDRIHPDDLSTVAVAMAEIAAGRTAVARCRIATAAGGNHWVEVRGKPYVDAEGTADGVIAAVRIVDHQVAAERQLERLARFDALTGLVSRSEALAHLEYALTCSRTAGTEPGVLFCDVDRFKAINDTYGRTHPLLRPQLPRDAERWRHPRRPRRIRHRGEGASRRSHVSGQMCRRQQRRLHLSNRHASQVFW